MDVVNFIPELGAAASTAIVAWKSPELLKEIYGDLAKPGVRQVGDALGEVLRLGNLILLPLRLFNESARQFEIKNFEKIADRFSKIPEERVISAAPEIAVPILENLSHTRDETLKDLFIELLAKVSDSENVALAHPSFVNVISSLSPDEARLIKFLKKRHVPFITLSTIVEKNGRINFAEFILEIPDDLVSRSSELVYMYISNLKGLGLIDVHRDKYLQNEEEYNSLLSDVKNKFPEVKESAYIGGIFKDGDIVFSKGIIEVTGYGSTFYKCCIG